MEPFFCDLSSTDELVRALRGVETVYHTAGLVAIGPNAFKSLYKANVELTKNVVEASLESKIGRLVFTATIEAFDLASGEYPITEESPIHPDRTIMPYGKSKALALLEIEDAVWYDATDAVEKIEYEGSKEMVQKALNRYTQSP